MLFNSFIFICVFLPVTLIGYFLLNHRLGFLRGKLWLIMASGVFYAYFNIRYLPLIIISILANYLLSQCMLGLRKQWLRRLCLVMGLVANIGMLGYYKYYNFFAANINAVFGSDFVLLRLALPLGISFFTFQQLSYVIDSYRGTAPRYRFIDYALFVAFFPYLTMGPIALHDEIVPQFADVENRRFRAENFAPGLYSFALGLAKKVLIADTFAKVAEYGFAGGVALNSGEAMLVIVAYTLQLYFDFSGYCDMALGLGRMFNIYIPINFNSPYKSLSIKEFWERWHMTLSRFFMRYLYIPLGGSRKGELRTYLNLLIVFLISGLWHMDDARWLFLLWGLMHGVASVLYRLCRRQYDRLPAVLRWALTFLFVMVTWVVFRAPTLAVAGNVLGSAVAFRFGPIASGITSAFSAPFGMLGSIAPWLAIPWFLFGLIGVARLPNAYELTSRFKATSVNAAITVALLLVSMLSLSGVSAFLYSNF